MSRKVAEPRLQAVLEERARRANRAAFDVVMARAGGTPAREGDEVIEIRDDSARLGSPSRRRAISSMPLVELPTELGERRRLVLPTWRSGHGWLRRRSMAASL